MSFRFGTKAETLRALRDEVRSAQVLDLEVFTVAEWRTDAATVLSRLQGRFSGLLAVRSSAIGEDGAHDSQAGANDSRLDVSTEDAPLSEAIEAVIASYKGNPRDQILVQPMLAEIAVSGVMTTHVLTDGAPYYVVDYDDESGKTDTVTGGTRASKTVLVHRAARLELVESERVRAWLGLIKELEAVCRTPLNVEFAQAHDGSLYLLQVRRISVARNWNRAVAARVETAQRHVLEFLQQRSQPRGSVLGRRTILGEMPDWNPAEIIGTTPRPLAASLYRHLITRSVWRRARARLGYRDPLGEELLLLLGSRPYIDVRNSFNSFLPADLPDPIGARLVDAWLDRLDALPHLHDKVEFEIAQTVCDFDFDATHSERYGDLLRDEERTVYRGSLAALTARLIDPAPNASLARALARIEALEQRQRERRRQPAVERQGLQLLAWADLLLSEGREEGALPFAEVARHAFVAESLLRSAVTRAALTPERLAAFKRSVRTVAGDLSRELSQVQRGQLDPAQFLDRYGHLRPGTYDVRSQRYDQRRDLFSGQPLELQHEARPFQLTSGEERGLAHLLGEIGSDQTPARLLRYAELAIAGREWAKFVFTRDLSDALEVLAAWGETIGLTREDLSFLPLHVLLDRVAAPLLQDPEAYLRDIAERQREHAEVTQALHLGYLLRDERDVFVVPLHRSAPNFVTHDAIEARAVVLGASEQFVPDLYGAVVLIESADPGYDWIFGQGISGLVTMWGGSNSHMAIRCTEFGIPAAIGCGERTFAQLARAPRIRLACGDRLVEPVHD